MLGQIDNFWFTTNNTHPVPQLQLHRIWRLIARAQRVRQARFLSVGKTKIESSSSHSEGRSKRALTSNWRCANLATRLYISDEGSANTSVVRIAGVSRDYPVVQAPLKHGDVAYTLRICAQMQSKDVSVRIPEMTVKTIFHMHSNLIAGFSSFREVIFGEH